LQVLGIKTDLIRPGDDLAESLEKAMAKSGLAFQDGDILVVSESTVATAEGELWIWMMSCQVICPNIGRKVLQRPARDGADHQGIGRNSGRYPWRGVDAE